MVYGNLFDLFKKSKLFFHKLGLNNLRLFKPS